jgi:hypothetical protein
MPKLKVLSWITLKRKEIAPRKIRDNPWAIEVIRDWKSRYFNLAFWNNFTYSRLAKAA